MRKARSKVASRRRKYKRSFYSPPAIAKLSFDATVGRIDTFKPTTISAIDGIDDPMAAICIRNTVKYGQEAKAADQNEAMEQHLCCEFRRSSRQSITVWGTPTDAPLDHNQSKPDRKASVLLLLIIIAVKRYASSWCYGGNKSADIKFGGGMAKKERDFRSKKSWRLGLLEARSLTL